MRLHMLGLPHTRTLSALSHCAYTGKVHRFAKMMAPLGYEVLHYGVGSPDSEGWADHINVMQPGEQTALLGYDVTAPSAQFVGRDANVGHPVFVEFNARLAKLLKMHVKPGDIICAPMGVAHAAALQDPALRGLVVETGVGYPDYPFVAGYRIYESYAWWNHMQGWGRALGTRSPDGPWLSEWVVPNYFDVDEWLMRSTDPAAGEFVLYFGRICDAKGVDRVIDIARARPELRFVLCGQGDPGPYLGLPNVEYHPPVHGRARAELFYRAKCLLMPTQFLEPFGGVAVEATLTGTPVLTSDSGAFVETMPAELRCRTLGDWLHMLDRVTRLTGPEWIIQSRSAVAKRYSLDVVGRQYDRIFKQIPALRERGCNAGGP